MKERARKMKTGLRDKRNDCNEMVMKIEAEWRKMFSVCVCVCT